MVRVFFSLIRHFGNLRFSSLLILLLKLSFTCPLTMKNYQWLKGVCVLAYHVITATIFFPSAKNSTIIMGIFFSFKDNYGFVMIFEC